MKNPFLAVESVEGLVQNNMLIILNYCNLCKKHLHSASGCPVGIIPGVQGAQICDFL